MPKPLNPKWKPLCEAPFRNKGTFYTDEETGAPQYTPCCYRNIPALDADNWQSPSLCSMRRGLAGLEEIHPSCAECLTFGSMATARLYDTPDGTYERYGFDQDTGTVGEVQLTSCIYIGPKCNLACRMCNGRVSNTYNYAHPELAEPVVKVSSRGYDLKIQEGVYSVCVAGGEPLLFNGTIDIVKECSEKNLSAFIITNGSVKLEGNKVYEAVKAGKENNWVMVSLDADWELHEWIRVGIDIELLKRNIKTLHQDGVLRAFNIVVSKLNYDRFLFPLQLAHEMGVEADITFLNEPSVLSCKHVEPEKRRAYAKEVLRFVKANDLAPRVRKAAMQAISGLLQLPYEGSSDDEYLYKYLTRDVTWPQ